MGKTVLFRDFEERDIDFIYKCKNDPELNKLIVGQYHPFTYEEAVKWVHGCMGEHETFKFWAVCTNDDEKRIVGWTSISQIDFVNKSTVFHSIVIGDPLYRKGFAWIETYIFVLDYVFERLNMNSLHDSYLPEHPVTGIMLNCLHFQKEGVIRQAIYRNSEYHDKILASLLSSEYFEYKKNGEYEIGSIIRRFFKEIKNKKE